MKCYGEIDFIHKTINIERKPSLVSTELKRSKLEIDRLIALWLLEKRIRTIFIDKESRIIAVYIPYFSDWVILQNDYLPYSGEYFLN